MFSSVWLIWKVIAIRFSHRNQCLIASSFDVVLSTPLHLNQIFCVYLYLSIKKVILLLNMNNLYKLQIPFFTKAILPLICSHVFLGDPHIHPTSFTSRLLLFQIFYIFLRGSYTVNMFLKIPLFWTFWTFVLPLFVIFYIYLTCTDHVRPAPILSICHFFFFNLVLFLPFRFTWHAPIVSIIH